MTKDGAHTSLEQQKAIVIAHGELYRVGLVHAKANLAQSVRPEAVLHRTVEHALGFASARIDHLLSPTGLRLHTVMPYLLGAFSLIARKKLVKPALGVIAVGAVVAVAWFMRRKRR